MNSPGSFIPLLLLHLLSSCMGLVTRPTELTYKDVNRVSEAIKTVVKGDLLPTAVRLVFHDCVGGCNGCIDLTNGDNNGLDKIINPLEKLYEQKEFNKLLSRADYWTLAGYYALNETARQASVSCSNQECLLPDLGLVFKHGRIDCEVSPNGPKNVLPGGHFNHSETMTYFKRVFNFSMDETVAILGAHTLGKASKANSGFQGLWVPSAPTHLNNEYYKLIASDSIVWKQSNISPGKGKDHFQWTESETGAFMLNPDMALFKDLEVEANGRSTCNITDCPDAPSAQTVLKFANSNYEWIKAFSKAFMKMSETGAKNLKTLSVDTDNASAADAKILTSGLLCLAQLLLLAFRL